MKNACCIYRIDDIAPGMNWDNFYKFLKLFRKYNVVPLVGIVPENKDPKLMVGKAEESFWKILKKLYDSGQIEVSQHGYNHKYITNEIQPFYRLCGFKPQSEFCGVSYKKQFEMIKAGKDILNKNGIPSDTWMAPGHSFDKNTVRVLKALKFKAVTDGIGLFPEKKSGITFVPQQEWNPGRSLIGVKTICLHLNSADDELYKRVEKHLKTDTNIVPFKTVLNNEILMHHYFLNYLYKVIFFVKSSTNRLRDYINQSSII